MASYSALPEPMLARSGRLPASGDYSFEVKWAGFLAIVSTAGALCVRDARLRTLRIDQARGRR